MQTLSDEFLNSPRFKLMRNEVHELGCGDNRYFGAQYAFEGGYWLQQNPDELTALILFLQDRRPLRNYLEIGVAAGGTALALHQLVGFQNVYLIDDSKHPQAIHQKELLGQIPEYQMFVGDSHSQAAKIWMFEVVEYPLDVVFIDGDHSAEGVYQDVQFALTQAHAGTLLIFHDMVIRSTGVLEAWERCIREMLFLPLTEFIGKIKPMGIGIAQVI